MKELLVAALCAASLVGIAPACAGQPLDRYKITAEEMSACGSDAIGLCSSAYPDEAKLISCMKSNRVSLSATCRPVFDAGVRRRHL